MKYRPTGVQSTTDGISSKVSLSDRGRELLDAKRAVWEQRWREMLDRHSGADLATAARVMHDIGGLLDSLGR